MNAGGAATPGAPTLFISDLHLAPGRDGALAAFHALARGPAREATAVYVMGDLFDAWRGRLTTLGQMVTVFGADTSIEGIAEDVTEQGALIMRDQGGILHELTAGEVSVRRIQM